MNNQKLILTSAMNKILLIFKIIFIFKKSVGWITGAQVTYCAEAFPTVDFSDDAPILSVLGAVLRNVIYILLLEKKVVRMGLEQCKILIIKFLNSFHIAIQDVLIHLKILKSRENIPQNISQDQLDEGILGIYQT